MVSKYIYKIVAIFRYYSVAWLGMIIDIIFITETDTKPLEQENSYEILLYYYYYKLFLWQPLR